MFFERREGCFEDQDKWVFGISMACDNKVDVIIPFSFDCIFN